MPFLSTSQRKWMYANKPEMAKKWEKHTPKGVKLPKHVKKHKMKAIKKHFNLVTGRKKIKRKK